MNINQINALRKIANGDNAMMGDPSIGQAVGASWQSFKTGLKDKFNPKAWVANTLTGGNYTKDRQLAARQQYYASKQQPQAGAQGQQPQQMQQPTQNQQMQ